MSLLRITFLFLALVPVSVGGLIAQTGTAFKTGERTTGMTKQCFYDYIGNGYTRTVRSVELCPLTIQVRIRMR
jgi:predicted ABC-type sugar transport system permease subunit